MMKRMLDSSPSKPFLAGIVALALVSAIFAADPPVKSDAPTEKEPAAPAKPAEKVDWAGLFKIHWQNRTRAFQEQNQAWSNVVLLGDSITEGFDVTKYFPGRRVLNRGIGADIIGNALPADDPRGLLRRLDNSVFDCAATDLFILIGINDLNSGHPVETMAEGYRELLGQIRKRLPLLRIYVQSVLPTRGNYDQRNDAVRQFNAKIEALAAEFHCTYLDLHSLLKDSEGRLKAEFTMDGLHLTDPAYQIWRAKILEVLRWN